MKSAAQYIADAKAKLGAAHMSDQKLGDHLGYAQQTVAKAKSGGMSDHVGIKIAEVLGIPPGEVLWVARAERERDPVVRGHLERWARDVGKILASVPAKAVRVLVGASVALGMMGWPAHDAQAFGGAGGIRTLDAGFAHILP